MKTVPNAEAGEFRGITGVGTEPGLTFDAGHVGSEESDLLHGPPFRRFHRVKVSAGELLPPPIRWNTNLLASLESIFPASGGPFSWVKLSTSLT